jgi:cytochrome b subunit of formate dehydrogenase
MDAFRIGQNPWGETVLLGLSWNVVWLVVAGGLWFMAAHAYYARRGKGHATLQSPAPPGLPEKITRHGRSARWSHWALAAATLTLLITAFVPILGLKFPWVTVHWVAGIVLSAYIVYHVLDTLVRLSWTRMWIGPRETIDAFTRVRAFTKGGEADLSKRPGKWGIENKVFHHLTAVAGFGVVVTGILMMARIDTWFWSANPYFRDIADSTWGWVFVIHGVCAAAFVGLVMAHLYLAFRPDKLWFTRSMFKGWITREEYLGHFNPARWRVVKPGTKTADPEKEAVPATARASSSLAGTRE